MVKKRGRAPTPFCKRGHDKRVVGTYSSGQCRQCRLSRSRRQNANRQHREAPIPNLRAVRESFGFSQEQFAQAAGLHRNCISALERGRSKAARPATREKIIRAVVRLKAKQRGPRVVERVAYELIAA